MLSNSNLSQIWEEEITTSDWEWIEAELKPGEQGHHYIVNLASQELDPSEPYPVPLDFKSVDVRTASPGYDAIRELLDDCGYEQWDVMQWRYAPVVEEYEF